MREKMSGHRLYHEGVFGEKVSTWHSGGPGWCAWVRCRRPPTEPAADSPNYEDSEERHIIKL